MKQARLIRPLAPIERQIVRGSAPDWGRVKKPFELKPSERVVRKPIHP